MTKKIIILCAAAAAIAISALLIFFPLKGSSGNANNTVQLQDPEILEYQGENLTSLSTFRDNSIKGPQKTDVKNYTLVIDGLVEKKLSLSYSDVLKYEKYRKTITLHCVEGWKARILWEGVLLKDLLEKAGVKKEGTVIIFHALDSYTSSLTLDYILDNNILLACKMNGLTLTPETGFPFQVAAEDKWGYKWVKWVTRIEVSSDKDFRGYWEKAGYNQSGDLSGSKFAE